MRGGEGEWWQISGIPVVVGKVVKMMPSFNPSYLSMSEHLTLKAEPDFSTYIKTNMVLIFAKDIHR